MNTSKSLKFFLSSSKDRISSLPNEIVHQILGFLPTEDAIRASLLSTRWKYLWSSIPNLYIHDRMKNKCFEQYTDDYKDKDYTTSFQLYVDRVLGFHDSDNIHKFHLECTGRNASLRLEEWMCRLSSRHRVKEVVMEVGGDERMLFRVFKDLKELMMLEVRMSCVVVSDSMCFLNLKVLCFCSVFFNGEKLIRQLELGFPVLEEFTMRDCRWCGIKSVKVYAPALEKLTLDYFTGTGFLSFYETEMKMDAMNIKFLSIVGRLLHEDSLIYSPSLVNVSIDVRRCGRDSKGLAKCVTRLNYVKYLTLSDRSINNIFNADILNSLQGFPNLISLTVTNTRKAFSAKHLINLLCYMPNIESLIIHLDEDYDHEPYAGFRWTQESVSQCSLPKLKSVEIKCFNGSENEQCLIAYLLLRTIENMDISFNYPLNDPDKETKILKRIHNFPRGSPGTRVNVGGVQCFRAALKAGFAPARPGPKHRRRINGLSRIILSDRTI